MRQWIHGDVIAKSGGYMARGLVKPKGDAGMPWRINMRPVLTDALRTMAIVAFAFAGSAG
jgi:hypothetical protein